MSKKAIILTHPYSTHISPTEESLSGYSYIFRLNAEDRKYLRGMIKCCNKNGFSVQGVIHVKGFYDDETVKKLAEIIAIQHEEIAVIVHDDVLERAQEAEIESILDVFAQTGRISAYHYYSAEEADTREDSLTRLDSFKSVFAEEGEYENLLDCSDHKTADEYYSTEMKKLVADILANGPEPISVDIDYLYGSGHFLSLAIIGALNRAGIVNLSYNTQNTDGNLQKLYADPIGFAFQRMKEQAVDKSKYV